MVALGDIRGALSVRAPALVEDEERRRAAVAMVLREAAGTGRTEVLFIERAERVGDPWSGHMAFPGGRIDPSDADLRAAAERETLEEVGVDLSDAERLGQLDDLQGRRASGVSSMVISAFVYHLPRSPELVLNHEVEQAFWFPLRGLLDPERHVPYPLREPAEVDFPGILVGEPDRHVVWGLTYRFLETFFGAIGRPLPDRWGALRQYADG